MVKIDAINIKKDEQEMLATFMQFHRIMSKRKSIGHKRSGVMLLFIIKKSGKNEMKVSEISRKMNVKAPTVTQLVNELESKGQVERVTRSTDRRSVWIRLTEKGEQLIQQAEKDLQYSYSGLIDFLGEAESKQLIGLLKKVNEYFIEHNEKEAQE